MLNKTLRRFLWIACLGAVLPLLARTDDPKQVAADPSAISSILAKAKTYLGMPYRYGGITPKGFDCSGFVRYVFGSMGIDLDRTSGSQAKQGDPIDLAHIQPGDLLFFSTRGMRKGVSHVGIYLGEGQFIHASWGRPGKRCVKLGELASSYFAERLVAVRRIVTELGPDDKTPLPQ